MKPIKSAQAYQIYPGSEVWTLREGGGEAVPGGLSDLAAKVSGEWPVKVCVPSSASILERLRLPKAPREELVAMVQLQLEKLLPYPAEEVVFEVFEVGGDSENSEVLAVALHVPGMEAFCGELRRRQVGPSGVGVFAFQLAANVQVQGGVTLLIWVELGRPFLALVEGGKLLWMEGLPDTAPELAGMELVRALLGAELAGVNASVARAVLEKSGEAWMGAVREALPGVPVDVRVIEPAEELVGNWLPAAWSEEEAQRARKGAVLEKLQWAGTAYLGLLTVGFAWLAFQKSTLNRVTREVDAIQPIVDASNSQRSRWRQMEPAVDPGRYLVEILFQLQTAAAQSDVRVTEFQMKPGEFSFSGEAASLSEAIEYVNRLKKEPGLSSFQIQSPNPTILSNERAQFRVTAKTEAGVPASRR